MNANVNEISVNGIDYVPKNSLNRVQPVGPVKIVVLQRGWVMVGYYSRDEKDNCKLERASVIRNWGTTKGLGEIALGGPSKDTKLDPTNGVVEFHRLTEVATIACEESEWKKHLK